MLVSVSQQVLVEILRVEVSLLLRDALTPAEPVAGSQPRSWTRQEEPTAQPSEELQASLIQKAKDMGLDEEMAGEEEQGAEAAAAAAAAAADPEAAADKARKQLLEPWAAAKTVDAPSAQTESSPESAAPTASLLPPSSFANSSNTAGARACSLLPSCYLLLEACISELAEDAALFDGMTDGDPDTLFLPAVAEDMAGGWVQFVIYFHYFTSIPFRLQLLAI